MYRSFNRSPARRWRERNTHNHALVRAIYETQPSNSLPIERPLPPSCNGLLMSGTGQIASKLRSYLLSCLLKAIGDGDGQHCHRCNNKKQPKAYDQPKAV